MTDYGYTSVPGSAELPTASRGSHQAVKALEALDSAATTGQVVEGEWLARCVVRKDFVPVLADVYDRLALEQDVMEQAIYGHLYRLAIGGERNHCRVSRRDLCRRTNLSDRRLGKGLAGLVGKGHIRLVHRDRRGTLYRVMLPHEVFGESDRDRVLMARPAGERKPRSPGRKAKPDAAPVREQETLLPMPAPEEPATPSASRAATSRSAQPKGNKKDTLLNHQSLGALAADFCRRFGGAGREKAEVVEAILDRLEEGRSLEEAALELQRFGQQTPPQTPVAELGRFLSRQSRS